MRIKIGDVFEDKHSKRRNRRFVILGYVWQLSLRGGSAYFRVYSKYSGKTSVISESRLTSKAYARVGQADFGKAFPGICLTP